MDGSRFDTLTRMAGEFSTRRTALQSTLAGLAASGIAAVGLTSSAIETDAKKKKKKCKKCKPLDADSPCDTNKQCCTNETNRACAIPVNDAGGDKTCCGALDAVCGGQNDDADDVAPFCCADYLCQTTGPNVPGTCQLGPI